MLHKAYRTPSVLVLLYTWRLILVLILALHNISAKHFTQLSKRKLADSLGHVTYCHVTGSLVTRGKQPLVMISAICPQTFASDFCQLLHAPSKLTFASNEQNSMPSLYIYLCLAFSQARFCRDNTLSMFSAVRLGELGTSVSPEKSTGISRQQDFLIRGQTALRNLSIAVLQLQKLLPLYCRRLLLNRTVLNSLV